MDTGRSLVEVLGVPKTGGDCDRVCSPRVLGTECLVLESKEALGVFPSTLLLFLWELLSNANEFKFTLLRGDRSSSLGPGEDDLVRGEHSESGLGVLAVG